jgi:hypothetical protein
VFKYLLLAAVAVVALTWAVAVAPVVSSITAAKLHVQVFVTP